MNLLPDEEKILLSNDNKVVLTNYRIQLNQKDWGSFYNIEIFLENISSVEVKYHSIIILLLLGALSLAAGTLEYFQEESHNNIFAILLMIGFGLLIGWTLTRQRVIRISSDGGGAINMDVHKMSKDQIQDFIDHIQLAKFRRVNLLFSSQK